MIRKIARRLLGRHYAGLAQRYGDWVRRGWERKYPVIGQSAKRVVKFHNLHRGQRCVIIGNGPSLKKMDLQFLQKEITFGLNRIYLLPGFTETLLNYYVCVNRHVLEQFASDIRAIPCPKFLSGVGAPFFPDPTDDFFFHRNCPGGCNGFSPDVSKGVWEGFTVTYVAMQIAYYMGFSEVALIGVDHSFTYNGEANKAIVMSRPDENHFSPDYFGPGVKWQFPDLENSELAYRRGKQAFEDDGRRIVDATLDGQLTVFPKVDYREYFGLAPDPKDASPPH